MLVDVFASSQTKVVYEVAIEQGFNSMYQRMRPAVVEPKMTAEVVLAGSDGHKAATCLEDDPGFLSIYVNGSNFTHCKHQSLKDIADLRALAFEVFIDRMVT